MALLGQDQERPSGETAWTVLDAANDLGDIITIDACRRVIDADLRGEPPARSDVAVLSAFLASFRPAARNPVNPLINQRIFREKLLP
jgi:hypothetical protein